ncbi:16325_t:CDS:2, partial [Racocetra fulgida]
KNHSTSVSTSSNSLASNYTSVLKKQSTLSQYIGRPLHASEIPKFECLILRATISVGVAFRWIENPEVRKLFHFISPHLKLPDRKSLSNRILTSATNELMGIVFITSSGEILIWGAEDISIERQRQEEVITRIYTLFNQAKELDTLVTKDDAASDNDLKLPADIKVTINRDSFWDSLTTLHKILHPFCGALDLMQRDKAYDINEENEEITSEISWNSAINEWEELLIDEEFEEDPDDLDNADIDFLDLEIHPAENQAT